jgi:hypothetical protein
MRSRPCALGLALILLLAPVASAAVAEVSPSPTAAEAAPGLITGFRSARFGMSEAQVRAAIAKDFKVEAPAIQTLFVAEQHTKVLTLALPQLNPGPCPAVLAYIFDTGTGALIHINVSWLFPGEANPYQRAAIQFAGERLAAYFHDRPTPPATVLPAGATGPQTVTFYAARDVQGHTVNVAADGVEIAVKDKAATPKPAKGPAVLRVAYDAT